MKCKRDGQKQIWGDMQTDMRNSCGLPFKEATCPRMFSRSGWAVQKYSHAAESGQLRLSVSGRKVAEGTM